MSRFQNLSAGRIVLIAWLVISVLYVGYSEYVRLRTAVSIAYQNGRSSAVAQVIAEAQKCQPFPVNVGEAKATLVSVECLQQAAQQGQAPTEEQK